MLDSQAGAQAGPGAGLGGSLADARDGERRGSAADDDARWSAWMRDAQRGDREAYRRLLLEIGGVTEAWLRRRFGDADFVEDGVQECLLAIHRARHSYDPRRGFRPWMFAIVRHKTIDLLRRRRVRERHEVSDEGRALATPSPEPAAAIDTALLLEALEPKYRDALVWTKLEGRSLSDAAARAGVSTTAMKSRVHRGIGLVRARLAKESDA
jgi:RNA polymerase sigma-70 factor (ECF subfamily)